MPGKAPDAKSAPYDPAYLFSTENYPEPSYLSTRFIPFLGGFIGFTGTLLNNVAKRRPTLSGVPYIIGATVGGLAAGIFMQNRNDAYWAERDAVYRHYISLHPEDFPARERVLVGDMFKSWIPIR